jgi:hypothetical protein
VRSTEAIHGLRGPSGNGFTTLCSIATPCRF